MARNSVAVKYLGKQNQSGGFGCATDRSISVVNTIRTHSCTKEKQSHNTGLQSQNNSHRRHAGHTGTQANGHTGRHEEQSSGLLFSMTWEKCAQN